MLLSLLIVPLLFTPISMTPPQLSGVSGGITAASEVLNLCASFENVTGLPYNTTINNMEKQSLCLGYMRGVLDAADFISSMSDVTGNPVRWKVLSCLPKGDTAMLQVVKVVLKYIKNHPEWLDASAAAQTLIALKEAFPCK